MMKGRRIAGRGEELISHAFGPAEDDVIIKQRLLTRTTTTRGEPPLKKLQKKFTAFVNELDKDYSETNNADYEKLYKNFLQEMVTFELPLLKSRAVVDANVREKQSFNGLQEEIKTQISQAKLEIEELKRELEESKIERRHKEECEAVRKLVSAWPPRSETEKIISDLEAEISELETEDERCVRTVDLRRKQFSLLLHVVDELQNTLMEDDQKMSEEINEAGGSDAMNVD